MNTTTLENFNMIEVIRSKNKKDEKDEKHAKEVEKQLKLLNSALKNSANRIGGGGTIKVQDGGEQDSTGASVDLDKRKQFRTLGVRVGEFKNNVKDFLTPRGFLDKTGISPRGSGGMISEYLDKKEFEKQGFVGAADLSPFKKEEQPGKYSSWMNPSSDGLSSSFAGSSEETQNENNLSAEKQTVFLKEIADNTRKMAEALGLLDKNLKKSGDKEEESSSSGSGIGDLFGKGKSVFSKAGGALKRAGGGLLRGGATLARGAMGAIGAGGGAALATGAMVAAPFAADYVAGKLGVGGKEIDTKQDDANWGRMSLFQKAESGLARGVEKVGGLFGGNIANEAAATRIATETKYLNKNPNGPSFIDKVKDTFNRGNSGTLKAQNADKIVNERALKAGAIDKDGKILDTDAYNKISNKVLQELDASGDGASGEFKIRTKTSIDDKDVTKSDGTYSKSRKFEENISDAKSVLGSTTLGALFSAKGLKTGMVLSEGSEVTDDNGKVSRQVSEISGERKSGGLFGKDSYQLTNQSTNDYDVNVEKKDYLEFKRLSDAGKGEEARKYATEAIARAKAPKSDLVSLGEMTGEYTSSAENVSPTSLKVASAPNTKSGELLVRGNNDNASLKQNREDAMKGAGSTNVSNTSVNNSTTQVTKFDLPTRKDDGSLNRYTGSRLAY